MTSQPFSLPAVEVFGSLESLALDEPEAQPLKVAGGELVKGQFVSRAGDRGFGQVLTSMPSILSTCSARCQPCAGPPEKSSDR
jgi:hypothetical protein